MERLTYTKEQKEALGIAVVCYLSPTLTKQFEERLSAYEDTALSPADIAALQAENKRLTEENASLVKLVDYDTKAMTSTEKENAACWAELAALKGQVECEELTERSTCTMTCQDEDSCNWQCSCGSEWTYEAGNPIDNNVKYCHECGAKVVSVKERRYNIETDEYDEIELMPDSAALKP
jgi:hypothetical protein